MKRLFVVIICLFFFGCSTMTLSPLTGAVKTDEEAVNKVVVVKLDDSMVAVAKLRKDEDAGKWLEKIAAQFTKMIGELSND